MKIKMTLLTLFLIAACVPLSAQPDKGTVVVDSLYSTRLENPMG